MATITDTSVEAMLIARKDMAHHARTAVDHYHGILDTLASITDAFRRIDVHFTHKQEPGRAYWHWRVSRRAEGEEQTLGIAVSKAINYLSNEVQGLYRQVSQQRLEIIQMQGQRAELLTALHEYEEHERKTADDIGCDASNWDGGSPETCEHCQMLRHADRIRKLLDEFEQEAL